MAASGYPPVPGSDAQSRVQGPAIAVLVVAALEALMGLVGIVANLLGVGIVGLGRMSQDERIAQLVGGTIGIVIAIIGVLLAFVAIFGALKMKSLQSYGMAIVASVVVMLPCSYCCCVGLPVGIWSLVTLMNADVKAAFR